MIDRNDEGLKVAYRDAPTEDEIKAILKKRKIARIINTLVFLILLAAASYFSYIRYKSMHTHVPEKTSLNKPAE